MDRLEIGKLFIGIMLAGVLVAIVAGMRNAESHASGAANEPWIKVTPAGAPMNVTVVKVDSARGVVCYGAVDLVLGTTLSCVKVNP